MGDISHGGIVEIEDELEAEKPQGQRLGGSNYLNRHHLDWFHNQSRWCRQIVFRSK
ncbi:hypothetical protein [Desulfocapsa sulfexigens]|uniref:hypothetical protein n=1 Tax=Desulfocapsa sulfexigens TaxID=65555 RepID=UPI00034D8F25|nr:hypothetical protein [Desulfocapsa sulfexigens]